jgi:alpha-tubulin suppressor-like RCC1 family protein
MPLSLVPKLESYFSFCNFELWVSPLHKHMKAVATITCRQLSRYVVGLGSNESGQLGLGRNRVARLLQPEVFSYGKVTHVAAGAEHSLIALEGKNNTHIEKKEERGYSSKRLILDESGKLRVLASGLNQAGQLGALEKILLLCKINFIDSYFRLGKHWCLL